MWAACAESSAAAAATRLPPLSPPLLKLKLKRRMQTRRRMWAISLGLPLWPPLARCSRRRAQRRRAKYLRRRRRRPHRRPQATATGSSGDSVYGSDRRRTATRTASRSSPHAPRRPRTPWATRIHYREWNALRLKTRKIIVMRCERDKQQRTTVFSVIASVSTVFSPFEKRRIAFEERFLYSVPPVLL